MALLIGIAIVSILIWNIVHGLKVTMQWMADGIGVLDEDVCLIHGIEKRDCRCKTEVESDYGNLQ